MTVQEIFQNGVDAYDKGVRVVTDMNELIINNGLIEGYEPKMAYAEFDFLVQYVLLNVALADNRLTPNEGLFIDKITDTVDIINLLENDKNSNWTEISRTVGVRAIHEKVDQLKELAHPYIDAFADMFGMLDACDPTRDYLGELVNSLQELCVAFCCIDGDPQDRELESAATVVSEVLAKPWTEAAKRIPQD